ncbi:MAG: hypothetical protein KGZ71_03650 [Desulfobulbaceae bacterium]|nr:hypothetical protein [Desulfobulbaceae bacterium]
MTAQHLNEQTMSIEKNLKTIMTIVLLIGLIFYHFLGFVPTDSFSTLFGIIGDCSSIYTIIRITITVLALYFTLTNSWIVRLSTIFTGQKFIGGKYLGNISISSIPPATHQDKINLTFKQNLLSTKLTGVIIKQNGAGGFAHDGLLTGSIVNEDSQITRFVVQIDNSTQTTYGLLVIRFEDRVGYGYFYETGTHNNAVYDISIKKEPNWWTKK